MCNIVCQLTDVQTEDALFVLPRVMAHLLVSVIIEVQGLPDEILRRNVSSIRMKGHMLVLTRQCR